MCEIGSEAANIKAAAGSARVARSREKSSPPTNTMTAPAAIPSIATDTARKERWYHVSTDRRRVSSTSSISVASVVKNNPAINHERPGEEGGGVLPARISEGTSELYHGS